MPGGGGVGWNDHRFVTLAPSARKKAEISFILLRHALGQGSAMGGLSALPDAPFAAAGKPPPAPILILQTEL